LMNGSCSTVWAGKLLRPEGVGGSVEKEYHVCTSRRISDEQVWFADYS